MRRAVKPGVYGPEGGEDGPGVGQQQPQASSSRAAPTWYRRALKASQRRWRRLKPAHRWLLLALLGAVCVLGGLHALGVGDERQPQAPVVNLAAIRRRSAGRKQQTDPDVSGGGGTVRDGGPRGVGGPKKGPKGADGGAKGGPVPAPEPPPEPQPGPKGGVGARQQRKQKMLSHLSKMKGKASVGSAGDGDVAVEQQKQPPPGPEKRRAAAAAVTPPEPAAPAEPAKQQEEKAAPAVAGNGEGMRSGPTVPHMAAEASTALKAAAAEDKAMFGPPEYDDDDDVAPNDDISNVLEETGGAGLDDDDGGGGDDLDVDVDLEVEKGLEELKVLGAELDAQNGVDEEEEGEQEEEEEKEEDDEPVEPDANEEKGADVVEAAVAEAAAAADEEEEAEPEPEPDTAEEVQEAAMAQAQDAAEPEPEPEPDSEPAGQEKKEQPAAAAAAVSITTTLTAPAPRAAAAAEEEKKKEGKGVVAPPAGEAEGEEGEEGEEDLQFMYCFPNGGFNDICVQAWRCVEYARRTGRVLVMGSDNYVPQVPPYTPYFRFKPMEGVKQMTQEAAARVLEAAREAEEDVDVYPRKVKLGRLLGRDHVGVVHREEGRPLFINVAKVPQFVFDFNATYDERVAVYHKKGNIGTGDNTLRHLLFSDEVKRTFLKRWAQLPKPYIGFHIRSTDRSCTPEKFKAILKNQVQKLSKRRRLDGAPVYLATDNPHMPDMFREELEDVQGREIVSFTFHPPERPAEEGEDEAGGEGGQWSGGGGKKKKKGKKGKKKGNRRKGLGVELPEGAGPAAAAAAAEEEAKPEPLHLNTHLTPKEKHRTNVDGFVDLLLLAFSRRIITTCGGYTRLARFLHGEKATALSLIGEELEEGQDPDAVLAALVEQLGLGKDTE